MKTILSTIALLAVSVGLLSAEPINKICPVADRPAKADVVTEWEGKQVAFCCNRCKARFEAEPERYADKLKEEQEG